MPWAKLRDPSRWKPLFRKSSLCLDCKRWNVPVNNSGTWKRFSWREGWTVQEGHLYPEDGEGACWLHATGHCPWSRLAKGHQVLHKWLLLFIGSLTLQNKVGGVSCLKEGCIQCEGGGLGCAHRGLCAVWEGAQAWVLPARLLCVQQCSPLRLQKCTFPSCSSAWRFLGWVTC